MELNILSLIQLPYVQHGSRIQHETMHDLCLFHNIWIALDVFSLSLLTSIAWVYVFSSSSHGAAVLFDDCICSRAMEALLDAGAAHPGVLMVCKAWEYIVLPLLPWPSHFKPLESSGHQLPTVCIHFLMVLDILISNKGRINSHWGVK